MEMRACLESDKKQAIEALRKKFELEKEKCINDAKRKQWVSYYFLFLFYKVKYSFILRKFSYYCYCCF